MASIPKLLVSASTNHAVGEPGDDRIGIVASLGGGLSGDGETIPASSAPRVVNIDVSEFAADAPIVQSHPRLFAVQYDTANDDLVDPRRNEANRGKAFLRGSTVGSWDIVAEDVRDRLAQISDAGAIGIVLRQARRFGGEILGALTEAVREANLALLIDANDLLDEHLNSVRGRTGGFVLRAGEMSDATILAARERLRPIAPLWLEVDASQAVTINPGLIDGMIAHGLPLSTATILVDRIEHIANWQGVADMVSSPASTVAAVMRTNVADLRAAHDVLFVLKNRSKEAVAAYTDFGEFEPLEDHLGHALAPSDIDLVEAHRRPPVRATGPGEGVRDIEAAGPRLVLETIVPSVEGGCFPVKRLAGETTRVTAQIYADGHEQLAAEVRWRAIDEPEWRSARMSLTQGDEWSASIDLGRLGRHEFIVEGWLDRFGGFQRDFGKKLDAGVATAVDYAEGQLLVEQGLARAKADTAAALSDWLSSFNDATDDTLRASMLLGSGLASNMALADDRPHRIRSAPQLIDAERKEASFSSWYELFPRSATTVKSRHGTFSDVVERLPAIRAMGFDTLYFPPIHPIGQTNRKGPNNTLTPGPDDVGSPYAIGSPDGGHDAIHPKLGTFEDFRHLVAEAQTHGLEIAIDFAIQCSPDHPWLKDHPGWFTWRPDGSMKYAENPPKKYQDIVNVDFYGPEAIPALWIALRDVVLFWVRHGVKTFRVDNPHTKPLPFWEWMIASVRARHPEAIFLAEAFTRPSMMYRLAKVGFSQSYTYFTWRNGKQELIDYITELTSSAPKEFYRPHFFVNTPDINPPYLQTSGRPGFRVRAALAATLSGLFGVYSGFELCESAPIPGKEEYLDSEKYEIRPRDWSATGNIITDIELLNRLRRTYPALQTHLNTRFYTAQDDNLIYYGKAAPDGSDMILVMINLDPHSPHDAHFEVPLWEFGMPDDGAVSVEDLASGRRFDWFGKRQWIRISPDEPYRIWRIWSAK